MPQNHRVAERFEALADLLEVCGESFFRIRAYRRAAERIRVLPEDIGAVAERGGLTKLDGVGRDLAAKIQELLETGTLALYEQTQQRVPPGLTDFLSLPGLSPRLAHYLFEYLRVRDLDSLEDFIRSHMLRTLEGVDKAVEEEILHGIEARKTSV